MSMYYHDLDKIVFDAQQINIPAPAWFKTESAQREKWLGNRMLSLAFGRSVSPWREVQLARKHVALWDIGALISILKILTGDSNFAMAA
jgi:hypothetical protein